MPCVRDSSGKPTARHERGLAAHSPTRRGTPQISRLLVQEFVKLFDFSQIGQFASRMEGGAVKVGVELGSE